MTNSPLDETGVVEAVGNMFSGSLKVNGVWYSNAKGLKNMAQKGQRVTLSLAPWKSNGKEGVNIVDVLVHKEETGVSSATITTHLASEPNKLNQSAQGRDYDAENRGKVRHGLLVPLMPLLATQSISMDTAKKLVEELVIFVMGK